MNIVNRILLWAILNTVIAIYLIGIQAPSLMVAANSFLAGALFMHYIDHKMVDPNPTKSRNTK